MGLVAFVQRLKGNKIFSFLSSIKLAAPLMIIISIAVATGTVIESLYNADYASMVIYKSLWFSCLLGLLWLNIFASTVSRIPYKKHHIGFVVTHMGLLTLLIGGMITSHYGIDGQLQVVQGSRNSTVVLPRLMLGYQLEGSPSAQSLNFEREITEKEGAGLDFLNKELGSWFSVQRYLPFAKIEKTYKTNAGVSQEVSLSFILKSQFFNVTDWLNTKDQPQLQMGPATLKILRGEYAASGKPKKPVPAKARTAKATSSETLIVLDAGSGKELQKVPVAKLQAGDVKIDAVVLHLKQKLYSAIVAGNKLAEGEGNSNPALELEIHRGTSTTREVVYAKHKNFALNPQGAFGLRFNYESDGGMPGPTSEEDASESEASTTPGGNVIEFHIAENKPDKVQVVLFKNGQFVQQSWISPGENVQTPWMGMKIFLGTVVHNSEPATEAHLMAPAKHEALPPSAVLIKPDSEQEPFWLSENEEQVLQVGEKRLQVFFGRENLQLPFEIYLEKFSKIDYPGTETPLSFESLVQINQNGPLKRISMNEPLKIEGYTVYQASYVINPGSPPISVFSVNKDPGRWIKYLGSIILALGVITFTLMKSRVYKNWESKKENL
jgi:ResB-like family protein